MILNNEEVHRDLKRVYKFLSNERKKAPPSLRKIELYDLTRVIRILLRRVKTDMFNVVTDANMNPILWVEPDGNTGKNSIVVKQYKHYGHALRFVKKHNDHHYKLLDDEFKKTKKLLNLKGGNKCLKESR